MEKYYFVELRAHSFSKTYLVPRCESIKPVGIPYSLVLAPTVKTGWIGQNAAFAPEAEDEKKA